MASTPPVLGHLADTPARLASHESAATPSFLGAPVHAVTPSALWGLRECRSPLAFTLAPLLLEASSIRFALTHTVLDEISDSVAALGDADDAVLGRATYPLASGGVLQRAIRIRRQAHALPVEIRAHSGPQRPTTQEASARASPA